MTLLRSNNINREGAARRTVRLNRCHDHVTAVDREAVRCVMEAAVPVLFEVAFPVLTMVPTPQAVVRLMVFELPLVPMPL